MYCPKCRTQYVEKVEECFDCKVPLVEELPEETPLEKMKWVALTPLNGEIYAEMIEEVLQKINVDAATYESLGDVQLKGREKPINIFKIL